MATELGKFGVNTYSYTLSHAAADCVDHLASIGISTLELMAVPGHLWPSELDAGERRTLRQRMVDRNVRLVSLNMPSMDINLAAASKEMRDYTLKLLCDLVILAGDLGAQYVLLGPGKSNPLFPPPYAQLVERFYASLDVLNPLARSVGTSLLIENVPICFAPDAKRLMLLLKEYGQSDIDVVYDVANAHYIGENLGDGLRAVRDRLRLVHLSDTGQRYWKHDPVGDGDVPFHILPEILTEIGYREIPVLEIISPDADAAIMGSVRRLANLGWTAVETR